MRSVIALTLLSAMACAATFQPPEPPVEPPLPIPAAHAITMTVEAADSIVRSQGGCALVPGAVNCRWQIRANGVLLPVPDGLTYRAEVPQPAVGDSVVFVARLQYLSPTGIPSTDWSAPRTDRYVRQDQAPPVALVDSIINVTVTVLPGGSP